MKTLYLFLGGDPHEKDSPIKTIISSSLPAGTEEFNLDTFYGEELRLDILQERLKSLPVNSPARVIVIKSAHRLRNEIKEYLLDYAKKPFGKSVLILEADPKDAKDAFIAGIAQHARVSRFSKGRAADVFSLCRYIDSRQGARALGLLSELLRKGERPERIIGGMRYCWGKGSQNPAHVAQRMSHLLECDRQIKTGKLKSNRALEKLVIELSLF